ncbi:uncharacterized protein EI90DRAFT_3135088 [Cantharellus anzutake]|uniref:uncharacterized protein n=1 Tax=Cantharellus anzutake TaxID=1750568 RepID=UPI0019075972|nr:uncharacterized protein EI90DRAFT_3135088 [Cantharellus anzutake]KAF8315563.1 hypothetical protein EI90DRAFT_3135088 [Cantharellus anzutake]
MSESMDGVFDKDKDGSNNRRQSPSVTSGAMDTDLPESNAVPEQQPSISGNHLSDPNGTPNTQTTKQQLIPSVSGHPSPIHDTQMMGQVGQNYVPDMMTAALGPSFPNFGQNMWVYNPNAP